jgi:phosphatidylglycerol:prolipoprotein diacylglycerol transferase
MSYYHHDLNPFAVRTEWFVIPWYWFVYVAGFFWLWLLGRQLLRRQQVRALTPQSYTDLCVLGWLGMLIGSRLAYVGLYFWSHYKANPWAIFKFWEGGMSFHGGVLGAVLAVWLGCRLWHRPAMFWPFCDLSATLIPPVLGLGRVANFINGELPGRPTELPWAVVFPRFGDSLPRHPSQLYEAIGEGVLLFAIMLLGYKKRLDEHGWQSARFLLSYGLIRFVVEFWRAPDTQLGLLFGWLTMGQLLCLMMIGLGVILHWRFVLTNRDRPAESGSQH